jgi:drug/metabolite transporter (DMT)-like permease
MIPLLLGLVAALCWSVHDLLARLFAGAIGPYRASFWVVASAAVLLLGVVLWRGQIWHAEPGSVVLALLMGLVYAVAIGALLKAFSLAPVSVVGPFTAGYPALILLWGVVNGLSPSLLQWFAVVVVLAGAVAVGRLGPSDGGLASVESGKAGVVIASSAIACIAFAVSAVLGQTATQGLGEYETTFLSRFPAAAVLALAMLRETRPATALGPRQCLALVIMGAMDLTAITAINLSVFYPGKELGAMAISSYGAIAALFGMLFLRESMTIGQWLGIVLIVAGVAIIGWPG